MTYYRVALQGALRKRISVNPKYSLRAFARDLGISPSYLSQVLNGTRGLTSKNSVKVFRKLDFTTKESELFDLEIRRERLKTPKNKAKVQKLIKEVIQKSDAHSLSEATFSEMSDWFPMVLLQTLVLKDAPLHSRAKLVKYCAKRLGLPEVVVKQTLDSFERLGLICQTKDGLERLYTTVWIGGSVPSQAIRNFHRQMISRAVAAIETQPVDERTLQSAQIPMLKSDYPEMEREIVRFRNHLIRKYGKVKGGKADTIYGLNLQLFRLVGEV